MNWTTAVLTALMLVIVTALYIRLRWQRAPQAYHGMIGVAACCLVAGALLGAWVLHLAVPKPAELPIAAIPAVSASPVAVANELNKFAAKIVGITDGDTVDALDTRGLTYSIRLAGIDAPETSQPFGSESTQHLTSLVSGKNVNLECENERSYGRLICKILLPNGEDACLDQVKAGMAWHYKQFQDEQSPADREPMRLMSALR